MTIRIISSSSSWSSEGICLDAFKRGKKGAGHVVAKVEAKAFWTSNAGSPEDYLWIEFGLVGNLERRIHYHDYHRQAKSEASFDRKANESLLAMPAFDWMVG